MAQSSMGYVSPRLKFRMVQRETRKWSKYEMEKRFLAKKSQ